MTNAKLVKKTLSHGLLGTCRICLMWPAWSLGVSWAQQAQIFRVIVSGVHILFCLLNMSLSHQVDRHLRGLL